MSDNNPFLFVHMPLDELRGDRLVDASPNRRYAIAHVAKIVPDPTFGSCLEFNSAERAYVEFPPWKLNPEVFLPASATHPNAGNPSKLTFSIWISPVAGDGEWPLIDCGLRPELQRLRVGFKKSGQKLTFTVLAPAETEQTQGYRWISETSIPAGPWMHFTLVWDPLGEGANKGHGDCQMYINGGFFSSSGKTVGEPPMRLSSAASFQTLVGWPSFHGKLAHFRIYTRAPTREEIAQDMDRDTERLRVASPLDYSLLDPLKRPMMFLDASDIGEKMQVVVKPLQTGLSLIHLPGGPPQPDNCHFEMAFRPGTLDLSANMSISASSLDGPRSWEAMAYPRTRPDGHDSVCIRCNAPRALAPEGVTVVLNALKSDRRFATRWTPLDLRYRNLLDGQGVRRNGRLQQWLQLAARNPPTLSMAPPMLAEGWKGPGNLGIGLAVSGGRIRLSGHVFCDSIQELGKKQGWQKLSGVFSPFGGKEIRFPGRVRWKRLSAGASEAQTLWWSDLIIWPNGEVIIAADLPRDILGVAGRVDVYLDGVSYSDERLWVV